MGTWLRLAALVPLALWGPALAAAQDPRRRFPPPVTLVHAEGRVDVARASGVARRPGAGPARRRRWPAHRRRPRRTRLRRRLARPRRSRLRPAHRERRAPAPRARPRPGPHHASEQPARRSPRRSGVVRFAPRGDYEIAARDLDGATVIAARTRPRHPDAGRRATCRLPPTTSCGVDPRGGEPRWTRVGTRRDAFIDWAERARRRHAAPRRSSQPLPVELTAYAPTLRRATGTGTRCPSMARRGSRASGPAGGPTPTDRGGTRATAGPGSISIGGAGRCTTTAAGAGTRRAAGTGCRTARGVRPGSAGPCEADYVGLGAARLELAAGRRLLRRRARRPGGRVGRQLVGGPAPRLRPARSGRPVLRRPPSLARPGARRLRAAASFAARTRRMGPPRSAGPGRPGPAARLAERRSRAGCRRRRGAPGSGRRAVPRVPQGQPRPSARRRRHAAPIERRPASGRDARTFREPGAGSDSKRGAGVPYPASRRPMDAPPRRRRVPVRSRAAMRRPGPRMPGMAGPCRSAGSGRSEPTAARRPSSGAEAGRRQARTGRVASRAPSRAPNAAPRRADRRPPGRRPAAPARPAIRRVHPLRRIRQIGPRSRRIRRVQRLGRVTRIRRVRRLGRQPRAALEVAQ